MKAIGRPSTFEFFQGFPDKNTVRDYIINARWPGGVTCTHCGHDEVYHIRQGKQLTYRKLAHG